MSEETFFYEQTASSRIKANIVSEYFPSYCKIITKVHKPKEIRYIDLFSGPGYYDDGNPSTPILIGKQCAQDEQLKSTVKFVFNDKEHSDTLKNHFFREFPSGTFTQSPIFESRVVGEDEGIKKSLMRDTHIVGKDGKKYNEQPSLLFIDPFGYKGIETKVLAEFLKNWGNEIFLFVNVKRIHPALENDKFDGLMKDLFPTTLDKVKEDRRYKKNAFERVGLIVQCLGEEYKNILKGDFFYTAFKFQEETNDATSHYILHLTKGSRGFDLVKQVYNDFANVGTIFDGYNTYTFDAKKLDALPELFDLKAENIDKLKENLSKRYSGKELTAHDLFEQHQTGGIYSRAHYTAALRKLVDEQLLEAQYTDNKKHRKSVLISRDCKLKFK